MADRHTVVVVGGGITGLTAATSLASRGIDVLLLEKNEVCGGLVNSFERDGFLFDGGVRAIENAGMIKPMLEELQIDLELYKSDISLGVEDLVISADRPESIEEYRQMLNKLYPESRKDVDRVIGVIKKFDTYMKVLFGSDSPFFKDPDRDRMYYLTTFIPWIFRFLATGMAVMRMRMPVEEYLGSIIKDRSLDDIISQHFFKKTPAFFAMSYFSLYTDYYYPAGGVGQIPAKLEEKLTELGGHLSKGSEVNRVDVKAKRVFLSDGRSIEYDKLIWAADLKCLYRNIETSGISDQRLLGNIETEQKRILASKGAESVFTLFMAVDIEPEELKAISHGHFFYTPSKKGLGQIQRSELAKLLSDWDSVTKKQLFEWLRRFCAFNTYEISIPVLNDSNAAPKGKSGIIASFLFDHELTKRITDRGWYAEFEQIIESQIVTVLSDSIYPQLKEKLIFKFSSSPLSVERRSGSSEGAIVGWSFEQPIPVDPGMLNMKNSVLTSLPDVYKAGQWSVSPAGIPTCILTARLVANTVVKELADH